MAESIYIDVPYYIYEPYENGTSDEMIENSIVPWKFIARTPKEVLQNINNKNSLLLSKDFLFSGIEISQLPKAF